MIEFIFNIYDLTEEETEWCKSNLVTKSYGHFIYKLLGSRKNGDASLVFYDSPTGFSIKIGANCKIPYEAIIKAMKKKFLNCTCDGVIRESKEFIISENGRIKYDYDVPLIIHD